MPAFLWVYGVKGGEMAREPRKKGIGGTILILVIIVAAGVALSVAFSNGCGPTQEGIAQKPPEGVEKAVPEPVEQPAPTPEPEPQPVAPPPPPKPLPPAQTVTLKCVADNSIISFPDEALYNHGDKSSIRAKGIDHVIVAKFDMGPAKGMVVDKAVLKFTMQDGDLFWAGVSTIAKDWVEGKSSSYKVDEEGRGSCFLFASWAPNPKDAVPWGRFPIDAFTPEMMRDPKAAMSLPLPREDFNEVTFYPGRCIFAFFNKVREIDDKGREVDVPPMVVEAMAAGVSYGLALRDGSGETGWNNSLASRESNTPMELVVTGRLYDETPPGAPKVTAEAPAPGKVKFTVVDPADESGNLAYVIKDAAGGLVARNRVNGGPGKAGGTTVLYLYEAPSGPNTFELAVMDRAGNVGPATRVQVNVPSEPAYDLLAGLKPAEVTRAAPASALDGKLTVWAVPDTAQVDPVSGKSFHRGEDRGGNHMWDPGSRTVGLRAARNEVVAFQLVLEANEEQASGLSVRKGDLKGAGTIPAANIDLYRTWYAKCSDKQYHPDPCVPLDGAFDIPWRENGVEGQKNQSVVVDIHVPKDAPAGKYAGELAIEGGGAATPVRIELDVAPVTIPDFPTFVLELNAYSGVGKGLGVDRDSKEYEKVELMYHQLGHAHRQAVNVLPYSQSGNLGSKYYIPEMEGNGAGIRVASWQRWDERFGKYLDGRAFTPQNGYNGPWQGQPVTHFYLPFHENWPLPIDQHYRVKVETTKYPDLVAEHARKAPHISEAFSEAYKAAYMNVAREYAGHIRQKGWDKTRFHLYLNNKWYWKKPRGDGRPGTGSSWWLLDEPRNSADFVALNFYGDLFWQGAGDEARRYIDYRIDLSRPQWQGDTLDGLATLAVVSRMFYPKNYVAEDRKDRLGEVYWHYGGGIDVGQDNLNLCALVYKDWGMGADGGLPYYTSFQGEQGWGDAERLAVVLVGTKVGIKGPVASLRLKVLRRAQQDIEYLNLVSKKYGRLRASGSLAKAVNLAANVAGARDLDDPGRADFSGLSEETFEAVRARLRELAR